MKFEFRLLVITALMVFSLSTLSCNKQHAEERMYSYKELYNLYSKASIKLHNLETNRLAKLKRGNLGLSAQNDTMVSTIFTEDEAIAIIQPLINPTVAYLQQNYDLNIHEYLAPGDPNIAIAGSAALRLDALELENRYADTSIINVFELNSGGLISGQIISNMADNEEDWYDCALRSLGIEAAVKMFDSGFSSVAKTTIKKKALRKMVTKIATRTLGVIGAAIAIYEYGDCMEWW
jgi:hypothetical protein